MSFNIRNYVSDDHIESIGEIATGQARIIQALSLDNSQKDKEIERLNNIINKAIEYVEDENIDVTTIRFNDIQDVKKDLLDILKGVDKDV